MSALFDVLYLLILQFVQEAQLILLIALVESQMARWHWQNDRGWHPEILRGVVLRVGRLLRQRLSMAVLEWGPRACVDAALGLVLAADLSPEKAFTGCEGCACGAAGTAKKNCLLLLF